MLSVLVDKTIDTIPYGSVRYRYNYIGLVSVIRPF